jgi:nicotinate-nucleotide pyrophosphorylase (carboxylating)
MAIDYSQIQPDEDLRRAVQTLSRIGLAEDLGGTIDWTSVAVIPETAVGACQIRTRECGVAAGLVMVPWILQCVASDLEFRAEHSDGDPMRAGQSLGILRGNVRQLLTAERLILNIVSRLCGVATLTASYVAEISESKARLYDTRKTTVGWRLMEKYAVRCGGGHNHRLGLHDGFLIKDNHLALGGDANKLLRGGTAIERCRAWQDRSIDGRRGPRIIELEIDSLDQLPDALGARPDIVLLDNFSVSDLTAAVVARDRIDPQVELEASGNVTIDTIARIAKTGVDRISSGAITHQATWLDLGLDWHVE